MKSSSALFYSVWTHSAPFQSGYFSLFISVNLTLSAMTVPQVCQRLTEYGVHFHRVLPEKRSQTGIMLGVYCKGVLIFEVLNGNRTPVLRFPWRETKKISFTVCACVFIIRNKSGILFARTHPCSTSCSCKMFNLSPWRKRRFAFRTHQTGLSTCFRQTATRPVSIYFSSALISTSSTCRWRPAKTTRNFKI